MVAEIITSPQNPRIQRLRRLSTDSPRKEEWFLLEGETLVNEALSSGWRLDSVYFTRQARPAVGLPAFQISDKLMRSVTALQSPPSIIAIVQKKLSTIDQLKPANLYLLVDAVQDPGNLGTLLRSATAFGAAGVLGSARTVHFYNPKVVRAAMGSTFKLQLCENVTGADIRRLLERTGAELIVADSHNGLTPDSLPALKYVLALGHETAGVSDGLRKLANRTVRIPMTESTDSLNVAVAGSILLYEIGKKNLMRNAECEMRNKAR